MDYTTISVDFKDKIALVSVNRPEVMNALNSTFFDEMDKVIASISTREEIKVMIITGVGKAFVAGADIEEMVNKNSAEGSLFSEKGQNTFFSLGKMKIPVIAAVNGYALGGGCELAMACDFRIASDKAKFGQPEVNLGLIPGFAATQRLTRLVGLADALYLLMTADMISAGEAFRIGLVQKVVENEKLMDEVFAIADKIASKGPKAIQKIKSVSRQGLLAGFIEGSKLESKEFGSLFGDEGEEGMRAFLEKRKPNW